MTSFEASALLGEVNYFNARPFDVHTWSAHPEVNSFVNEIYNELTSIRGNERINKRLLKVLLLDLYVAWCADRGGCANLNNWDKWIFRATAA